jgi:hypothetical protein
MIERRSPISRTHSRNRIIAFKNGDATMHEPPLAAHGVGKNQPIYGSPCPELTDTQTHMIFTTNPLKKTRVLKTIVG